MPWGVAQCAHCGQHSLACAVAVVGVASWGSIIFGGANREGEKMVILGTYTNRMYYVIWVISSLGRSDSSQSCWCVAAAAAAVVS